MKFYVTLLLSLLFQTAAFAQGDWAPLRADTKSYFMLNGGNDIYSLWIDSVRTENEDSVFYLNRVVRPCYYVR